MCHLFINCIVLVENQFQTIVKMVQSDGGDEFVNSVFKTCFQSNGITHRLSCPGTPEQNGMAERRHRQIVEIALTLMAHASVPHQYWAVTFQTATFLINRLPTSILNKKSPHEMLLEYNPLTTVWVCLLSIFASFWPNQAGVQVYSMCLSLLFFST